MGFFSDSKDLLITTMALPMLNRSLLAPYGKATNLRLNSTEKSAELILELKGEQDPLLLQIHSYQLRQEGTDMYLIVESMSTSREWLTELVRNYVLNRPLKLPPQAVQVCSRLL